MTVSNAPRLRAGLTLPRVLVLLAAALTTGAAGNRPAARSAEAVQTAYRAGVPHTDRQGSLRYRYDPASFFPRCLYHAVAGSFLTIKRAGFNCVHTWEGYGIGEVIAELRRADLQLLKHWPTDAELRDYASDPRILGWYLDEEPTALTYLDTQRTGDTTLMESRYREFLARKAAVKALDPRRPVFPLDAAWIPPGLEEWWERWNTAGDVSAHDNYPLAAGTTDLEALAASVAAAARITRERKPVWVTVQAFGSTAGGAAPRLPSAEELRGMVFTAVVHGATGIIFFAYDSPVTRRGQVIGMAPATPVRYGAEAAATPEEARRSRALWAGAAALNRELSRLTPWLLAPTSVVPYRVEVLGQSRTSAPVRTMLKAGDGEYILLASNIEKRPLAARLRFPGRVASVRRVEQDGSETALHPAGSSFDDSLGPFGAAVYRIRFRSGG